jgi:D-glycero-D-manno-heptose 1,7-bisphosphate phosphatase
VKTDPKGPPQPSVQNNTLPALRTVFLDRDGVINRKMPEGQYITNWQSFHFLPGVPESIAKLNRAGLRVLVVSNQRGVALGLYTSADVDAIQDRMEQALAEFGAHIDGFYFCPHDKQQCNCRKPLPGLFEQAKSDFPEIDPAASLMIGDSLSDIEFGRNLGMQTIFIEGDQAHREHRKPGASKAVDLADRRFPSLPEAVARLLS